MKERVPGWERAGLSASAFLMGVREARCIRGEYTLTLDDVLTPGEVGARSVRTAGPDSERGLRCAHAGRSALIYERARCWRCAHGISPTKGRA